MSFKVVNTDSYPRRLVTPRLSISADGKIGLNDIAYKVLGSPLFVMLYYDAERKALALGAAPAGLINSHRVTKRMDSNSYRISAKGSLDKCGIQGPAVFVPQLEGNLLVIELES